MGARVKFILIALIFLFGIDLHAQGIPYQLNPPAPNARVQFCPVPDGGYPCPTLTTVYSDSAATQVINQPISTGSSGNLSVYLGPSVSSFTVQLLGQGYGPQNRYVVTLGSGLNSLGAAINVKTLGAVGNGKFFVDGVTNGSNNQLTSATAVFSATDVNQSVYCIKAPFSPSVAFWAAGTTSTVTSFVNSSTITYSGTNGGAVTGQFCALTNPADPLAISTAFANCKTNFSPPNQGISTQQPPCTVYLPAGIYGVGATLDNLISTGSENCVGIIGDGMEKTTLVPTAGFTNTVHANGGWFINERCAGTLLRDFSLELASFPINNASQAGAIVANSSNSLIQDVAIYDQCQIGVGTLYGIAINGGSNVVLRRPTVITSSGCPGATGGLLWQASQGDVYAPFLSNSNQNLEILNQPSGSAGSGVRIWGGVIDEGSITLVINSIDTWIIGTTLTGGANCLSVDATSIVNYFGGYCGTFGAGTGGGITVASGGKAFITGLHMNAVNAGSACYTSAAYGGIIDDGTNRCTTSGGGTVYPSGGIINQLSLSHAQANAFQSGTLAAGTVQSFAVDQPIAVSSITWTPSNAFACTAGSFPTFSVTDGTVTLTTAATDTATNGAVTHTFANTTASILNPSGTVGTVIQIKVVTTGTCGTAPTNTNINVFWQATAPVL